MSFTLQCLMKTCELQCMPVTSWIKEHLTLVRCVGREDGRENQVGAKEPYKKFQNTECTDTCT